MRCKWARPVTSSVGQSYFFSIPNHFKQRYAFNFEETVWGWSFSISTWLCPSPRSKVHKDMKVRWVWCERTWQSPHINPMEHLWDELERGLQARPSCPISVPDLIKHVLICVPKINEGFMTVERHEGVINDNNFILEWTNALRLKERKLNKHSENIPLNSQNTSELWNRHQKYYRRPQQAQTCYVY